MEYKYTSRSERDTIELAENFEAEKFSGMVICLEGDLGTGKTLFTKGFAASMEIDETITSPSYNIIKEYYSGEMPLYHMDVYRLEKDVESIGLPDYFGKDGVVIIEWADMIEKYLPEERLEIKFTAIDENKRLLKLSFTNIEGNIIFSELPKGTYYVKEISSLEGYEINSQYRQVILRENNYKINDINIEFINYLKRGDLTIKKVDASTGLPIKNVMFALLKDDVTIFEGVTNEAGILEVRGLTYGTYFIKEIKAPDGYVMIEDKIEVNIDNVSKILEIKNELRYGNLVVKKVDYDSNLPIKNAKVAIFKDDITIFEGYTNEFGIIEVKNIPLGLYFVKEVEAPDGYVKNNQTYEVELIEHKKTEIVEIANELQKGNLVIKKVDKDTYFPIKNAKFAVIKDNTTIYEGYTNLYGILKIKKLPLGTYFIREVESLQGYVKNDNIYEIHLVENNKTEVVIIKNELKKGNLTIKKVDGNTKKPLYNTEFIILKDNTIIYKGITNKDGILKIDNLILGLYTIKEIKASNGYNINEEEISIIITDKENYIEITNERLINKEDYIEIPNIPNTNVNGVEILLYYEDKNKMHKRDL